MEAVAARRERGEKARKAWNRIDLRRTRGTEDGPGPAAYVNRATRYGDVATEVAQAKGRKRPAPPDEKPCAVCYDHCWYGCGCACHDSDGGEVSSQDEEASDGEVLEEEVPLPVRDAPRPSKPTPPRWPSLPDEGNERDCLVVARYLKAAGPDAAAWLALDDETLRLRLSGQVSLHDLRDVCGGALSWSALRSASLRTVLAPKRVARRVNASI